MINFFVCFCILSLIVFFRYLITFTKTKPTTPIISANAFEVMCAVHEAGHALTALHCTGVGEVELAELLPTGGVVRYLQAPLKNNQLYCSIVIGLAGLAGEIKHNKKFRSGYCVDDLTHARESCQKIIANNIPLPKWKLKIKKDKSNSLPWKKIFIDLSDRELEIFNFCYDIAKDILNKRAIQHTELVNTLLQYKKVNKDQLNKWFGSRSMLNLQYALKGSKFIY